MDFFLNLNENFTCITITGCDNGSDLSIFHENYNVKIVLENRNEYLVSLKDYKKEFFQFADKIKNFYISSRPKIVLDDEFKQNCYTTFWNE